STRSLTGSFFGVVLTRKCKRTFEPLTQGVTRMKARQPVPLIALLIAALFLGGCSRHSLYDHAISWERASAGLQVATVEVDELTIAYLSNENPVAGDTIVLIHGFGANKDNWTRLARELTDEFNVYAIDLPGHGDSSKELDLGYRFEDQ
ncbi:unnamed protein product, partial [Ectocarpus sp. 12 AP-2014]